MINVLCACMGRVVWCVCVCVRAGARASLCTDTMHTCKYYNHVYFIIWLLVDRALDAAGCRDAGTSNIRSVPRKSAQTMRQKGEKKLFGFLHLMPSPSP